jgi:molybdopterin/thiamine biosynthesis adenylyltransferase
MDEERLNRQMMIEGWDQKALDSAKVGVIGDNDLLASLYIMSASALGINNITLIAPYVDMGLINIANGVNPSLNLMHYKGFYTHRALDSLLSGCNLIVDLSNYAIANKLLLEKGYRENLPVIRGSLNRDDASEGFSIFTYMKGREWSELEKVVSANPLPTSHFDDPVLDLIAAGIVLEESKNALMSQKVSDEVISYKNPRLGKFSNKQNLFLVGAGALGNFAGLAAGYAGFRSATFIDPDTAEVTNLNRQILLYKGVGLSKAETLANMISNMFGTKTRGIMEYFTAETDISQYDAMFDCVDNFKSRIVMSEKAKAQGKTLLSGGTNVNAGQAVIFRPGKDEQTPAEFLDLYKIVAERKEEEIPRERRASCVYRPNPSVIMTNQIIGGLLVDIYRRQLAGQDVHNVFYDSASNAKIGN